MVCNMKLSQNPNFGTLARCSVSPHRAAVGVERNSGGTDVFLQNASGSLALRSGLVVYAKPEC